MLGEALAVLQRWFEVVPRSPRPGNDRASIRTLIDSTVEYLEHPQAAQDAAYRELWAQLRELWGQAQDTPPPTTTRRCADCCNVSGIAEGGWSGVSWTKKPCPAAVATDRMTAEWLARYGRYKFLGPDTAGPFDEMAVIGLLVTDLYPQDTPAYAALVAEVCRHSERGEWEWVGGMEVCPRYLSGESELVDAGLQAIRRMRCTNLWMHLAPIDQRRWSDAIGEPVPNDGFVGPPVFASEYGPTRQYYFDAAMTAAASRSVMRIASAAGVEPAPFDADHAVENGLDSLAMLGTVDRSW